MWNNINQTRRLAPSIDTFRAICESGSVFWCILGSGLSVSAFLASNQPLRLACCSQQPAAAGLALSHRVSGRRAALQQGSPSFRRSSRCFFSKSVGLARRCFCVAFRTASAMASHAVMLFISSLVTPIVVHCIAASAFVRRESRIRANSP